MGTWFHPQGGPFISTSLGQQQPNLDHIASGTAYCFFLHHIKNVALILSSSWYRRANGINAQDMGNKITINHNVVSDSMYICPCDIYAYFSEPIREYWICHLTSRGMSLLLFLLRPFKRQSKNKIFNRKSGNYFKITFPAKRNFSNTLWFLFR